jgi:hypothetical protein
VAHLSLQPRHVRPPARTCAMSTLVVPPSFRPPAHTCAWRPTAPTGRERPNKATNQPNKQANKQANKQENKQTSKQTSKQTNTQTSKKQGPARSGAAVLLALGTPAMHAEDRTYGTVQAWADTKTTDSLYDESIRRRKARAQPIAWEGTKGGRPSNSLRTRRSKLATRWPGTPDGASRAGPVPSQCQCRASAEQSAHLRRR